MLSAQAYKVRKVTSRAELDACMDCQWATFGNSELFWDVWFPVHPKAHLWGRTTASSAEPESREAAVQESKDRMWAEHVADPHSQWIYIAAADQDSAGSGGEGALRVMGSCQWRVYEPPTNPFPGGTIPDIACAVWTPGSAGDVFTRRLARSVFGPRVEMMAKPHVGLSWMAVRPEFQRRGIGSALMEYGTREADRLGLESFIEASDEGRELYARHGYDSVGHINFKVPVDDVDDGVEFEKAFGFENGYHFTTMLRPGHSD